MREHRNVNPSTVHNLDGDFRSFLRCLNLATEMIACDYIQLPVAGIERPVYRERVYCYELYHQLRLQMSDLMRLSDYMLCGELDKSGHPYIRGNALDRVKPDLLVHVALSMTENLVAIEIKPAGRIYTDQERPDTVRYRAIGKQEIKKDLRTLTAFTRDGRYHRAIYLIYGGYDRGLQHIVRTALALADEPGGEEIDLGIIDLYYHQESGRPATLEKWA